MWSEGALWCGGLRSFSPWLSPPLVGSLTLWFIGLFWSLTYLDPMFFGLWAVLTERLLAGTPLPLGPCLLLFHITFSSSFCFPFFSLIRLFRTLLSFCMYSMVLELGVRVETWDWRWRWECSDRQVWYLIGTGILLTLFFHDVDVVCEDGGFEVEMADGCGGMRWTCKMFLDWCSLDVFEDLIQVVLIGTPLGPSRASSCGGTAE